MQNAHNETSRFRRAATSLRNITVLVYDAGSDVLDRSRFQATLLFLFRSWEQCSVGKQTLPSITFQTGVSSACTPYKTGASVQGKVFIHVVMARACFDGSKLGFGEVPGDESWILNSPFLYSPHLIGHELGHNMGLLHAAAHGDEYGDPTCVMGGLSGQEPSICFNPPHTEALGWGRGLTLVVGVNALSSNFSSFYILEDVFYMKYTEPFVYVYKKELDLLTSWDTEMVIALQPGVTNVDLLSYFVYYDSRNATLIISARKDEHFLPLDRLLLILGGVAFLGLTALLLSKAS